MAKLVNKSPTTAGGDNQAPRGEAERNKKVPTVQGIAGLMKDRGSRKSKGEL